MLHASHRGYNILLNEGYVSSRYFLAKLTVSSSRYSLTLMRQGKHLRVKVIYTGLPALGVVAGKAPQQLPPPFLDLLDRYQVQAMQAYDCQPLPTTAKSIPVA